MDLRGIDYDQWVKFVFDHPVTTISLAWHWDEEYSIEPARAIKHMTTLFCNSCALLDQYTPPVLEQGFWFLPGPNGMLIYLGDESVEIQERVKCIQSIEALFGGIFSRDPLGTAGYMWWDSLITYTAVVENDLLRIKVLETLLKIRSMPETCCRESADHGLQHMLRLNSPLKERVESELRTLDPTIDFSFYY